MVFGALNALPLLAWIFREDQNFKINFKVAMAKLEDYAQKMQGRSDSKQQSLRNEGKAGATGKGPTASVMSCSANAALHSLLGRSGLLSLSSPSNTPLLNYSQTRPC